MQWYRHKTTILTQILRFFQMVGAIACIVYYGRDITAASKQDKYMDSKWMYALVVSSMSLVTSFLYFVTGFLFEFRAFALMAAWDLILTVLWAAVAGIFGTMYIGEKAEMDNKITQMKVAAGFDIANVMLWLVTGGYGVYVFFLSKGTDLTYKGRYDTGRPGTTKQQRN